MGSGRTPKMLVRSRKGAHQLARQRGVSRAGKLRLRAVPGATKNAPIPARITGHVNERWKRQFEPLYVNNYYRKISSTLNSSSVDILRNELDCHIKQRDFNKLFASFSLLVTCVCLFLFFASYSYSSVK